MSRGGELELANSAAMVARVWGGLLVRGRGRKREGELTLKVGEDARERVQASTTLLDPLFHQNFTNSCAPKINPNLIQT